ncbi:TonB-dependent receptor domain-containing protein [Gilvimarinus sp. F26214L]|uniref:TonB-dependent receptor domain-containing protein n=1 Tax=Gilvimarinus sp. DZF01 TaxID=3461371 RepID=UPI004045BE24
MSPRYTRKSLIHLSGVVLAASSIASPAVLAQQAQAIEEVVVTGSYIRNSKFAANNPVDSVSQEDLLQAGAPNLGNYIRDLTYTQNSNTVNNVNASNSGNQTGFGTTFNLRGLGENSTLTLVDGLRTVDSAISNLIPEIAIDRMEVVLDGGSALYGSDAVAGVVNLIPTKRFEGFRTRVYYQQDEGNNFNEPSVGMIFGKSFDNGVDWVVAGDYRKSTALMNYERPRLLRSDYGWANSGNPGVWRELSGATIDPGAPHGGTQVGDSLRDPSCGTFNEGRTDLGDALNNPSGIPVGDNNCYFTYSAQWPLSDGKEEFNLYQSLTWMVNDRLELDAAFNYSQREMDSHNTGTYQQNANNRTALVVPGDHPANPFGVDVGPHLWRPFAISGTLPSHFDNESGARLQNIEDTIQRFKVGARYEITGTWNAYTYYSTQKYERERDLKMISMPRLAAALAGEGGPNGDEWFNPFGSADPRSPYYVEGVTDNSQELVDWIAPAINNVKTSDKDLDIFEVTASGEVYDLPSGPVQMATGYQMRKSDEGIYHDPLSLIGEDYNTSITDSPPRNASYDSTVHAAFVEFEIPILDTLTAQAAVRHERFTTFDLDTTTPKIALRWEALPSLAIRASWGESFLAPTAADVRPFDPNEGCGEIFFGQDPLTGGVLNGGATCASGNPDLQPETSDITNLGITWEASDALSLSLDYQTIEYTDRIRTMNHTDMVGIEFERMLSAIGATETTYDPTPGSATREAANAWLAAGGYERVQRDPTSQRVIKVVRQSQNVSSVWVDLFDARARHRLDTDNYGMLETTLTGSYYTKYEYEGHSGGVQEALGNQNARTGIVPPVPKLKSTLRFGWYMGNHSASLTANYQHHVLFDDNVNNLLTGVQESRLIEAQTIVNTQYTHLFEDYFSSQISLSVGISNLFDERPQRLPILGGFESRLHSPWGRQFWMSVDWTPDF